MDKCPKCGAEDNTQAQRYTPTRLDGPKAIHGRSFVCGSTAWSDGRFSESTKCLRRQLAAANERAGRLERELEFYADLATWLPCPGPDGEPMGCDAYVDSGQRARKALEVPDAL